MNRCTYCGKTLSNNDDATDHAGKCSVMIRDIEEDLLEACGLLQRVAEYFKHDDDPPSFIGDIKEFMVTS